MSRSQKDTNFEINLLPVISMLAVIIAFLLLTTVWVDIGTLNVKQAMGEATEKTDETPPSLWVSLNEEGQLSIELKDAPKASSQLKTAVLYGVDNKINFEALGAFAKQVKTELPDIKTAMILPNTNSSYEDLIAVMDEFKKSEYTQLGIAPL